MQQTMLRTFSILSIGALIAGMLFSCTKKSNAPQCNLAALTDSTTSVQSVTQFTYDNQDRLSSIVVTGQNACTRTFQYMGNILIFTVKDTTAGILNEIDTITLNSNNLMQTITKYYLSSGQRNSISYFYDLPGTKQATYSIYSGSSGSADTIGYAIADGDLMYDSLIGQTTHKDDFTYNPAKPIVYGDPTYFRQLLNYGAYYSINVHMLDVLYTAGKSYKAYTYTYNNNKISQETLRLWTSGSTDTVTHYTGYSYTCR